MPQLQRIDKIEVMYSSETFVPRIWLYGAGKWIGQLFFYPNGVTLPPAYVQSGQVNLFYHLDDFQNVRDLLETEKDTYLLYCGPNGENGVQTSLESAGTGIEVKAA